jgi:alpha-galactosidase
VAAGGATSAAGGNAQTGGAQSTGGLAATGGRAVTGGSNALGGGVATGGLGATGGMSATGGKSTAGGATAATGGSTATGGKSTAGGTTATGGSSAAGGKTAAGGTTTTGGTNATGGTTTASTIVGATPPMGWNSWNNFGCSPSESLIKSTADTMVSSGMAAAGYKYVNIDDCWMNGRDSSGNLLADTSKFPSGIKSLADYVHGKGLKLGIYESPGPTTCAGKTGSQGHDAQDANTFASWGIDYLKYDLCSGAKTAFAPMGTALKATGRAIFYSINPVYGGGSCVPPNCSVDELKVCNMWRIEFDITNTWASVTGLIDFDKPLYPYAGPGHWNDPDMLEVGRGLSAEEDKSHFGMWAILAAPLITGNDITKMSAATKAILTNPDVIAVNQDPLGVQAQMISSTSSKEIWSKVMSGTNVRAVALFNRSASASSMSVTWTQIGLKAGAATVRDLYLQQDLGSFTDSYAATSVPSHGIVMLKVTQ